MLTAAVISVLVVQNHLLCERKVQELKNADFSTFPAISPGVSNLFNTFFMTAQFKELILDLVLFIAMYHGYYGPHITVVAVVASYV